MTTPHEAVTAAIALHMNAQVVFDESEISKDDWSYARDEATAAIEALREGAVSRLWDAGFLPPIPAIKVINAILGPPNEVPE